MINASPSLELARAVSGSALAAYLVRNGWSERPSKIAGISILSKQLHGSTECIELMLPVEPGFVDEVRRTADALRTAEAVEGRPMKSIVDDIHRLQNERTGRDVVPDTKFTVSRLFCPQCQDLIVAATHSQHVGTDEIRHWWHCESCGHEFRTTVRLLPLDMEDDMHPETPGPSNNRLELKIEPQEADLHINIKGRSLWSPLRRRR
jgi:ribosomal protein S27AE